jgi:predicted nuclease with TOPRIM domain|tara:strand:+ start:704 stop:967 length:264 start_codon:yes stop_codon:yes gene_type:complete
MNEEKVKQLLKELLEEIAQSENPDQELLGSAQRLQSDIDSLLNPDVDSADNTVMDDMISLEAQFATNYPVAEKIVRELVNSLSRIGI